MKYEDLERKLLSIVDPQEDCLRFYRMREPTDLNMKEYGKFKATDFDGPLVV